MTTARKGRAAVAMRVSMREIHGFFRQGLIALAAAALVSIAAACPSAAQYRDRGEPGDYDYLTLVLSWSPTHCQLSRDHRDSEQCAGDRPYSFVLHGLWPQYWSGYPEFCRTRRREWVSNEVIRQMSDIMPGKGLIIHQYRKHGSCTGMPPEDYFGLARALYDSVKIPKIFEEASRPQATSPEAVEAAFLEANPHIKPEMMAVSCRNGLVHEVRVCFGRDRKPIACGRNEDQRRLCRSERITLPPVSGRAASGI